MTTLEVDQLGSAGAVTQVTELLSRSRDDSHIVWTDFRGLVTGETRSSLLDTKEVSYTRGTDGRLLGQRTPGGDEYYVLDHLGSVTDITNEAGDVVQAYTYEPYGEIYWQQSSGYDNAWRFAQGYLDTETGLQKHGVRYYDRSSARFTQMDPMAGKIAQPVTLNGYQYADADPSNKVDPTGRFATLLLGLTGIAVAAFGSAALAELGVNEVVAAGIAGCVGGIIAVLAAPTPLTIALGCITAAGANIAFQ